MKLLARFNSSLTYPIAATLVLVTAVPVALVGFDLARYNREVLTTKERKTLTRQAVSLANEAAMYLAANKSRLDGIARTLKVIPVAEAEVQAELLSETAADSQRAFLYLQIADIKGDGAFVRDPELSDSAASVLSNTLGEAHRNALDGRATTTLRTDLPRNHGSVSIIGTPIKNLKGDIWGSLTAVLNLGPIEDRLRESASGGQYSVLFNQDLQIIASSDQALRGEVIALSPLLSDFRRSPVRLTRIYKDSEGEDSLVGAVAPISFNSWGILVERSSTDAFRPVRIMLIRTVVVTAIAGLVALGLGFLLARRLIGPIQRLDRVSSEIAEGNLTVRAPVTGAAELAHLAGNFNHMAGNIEALVRRLRQALRQNQELFLETIRTLAAAIDAKDPYTRGHSERVSSYSLAIARHLGLGPDEVFRVRIAAILHDVGKLGIREGILNKPGGLTEEEFTVMKQHPEIGSQIMAPIRALKDILPGIRNHHETWDGRGYPDGLAGEEIPLVARIIGAADTFDAMTTTRPYQKAFPLDFALKKMNDMSGTRFAPPVVKALLAAVEAGDITPPDAEHGGPAPQQEAS
ncbi:MAG: HD domain-containing phosphohydrolase [Acidobacteriota bacterium]